MAHCPSGGLTTLSSEMETYSNSCWPVASYLNSCEEIANKWSFCMKQKHVGIMSLTFVHRQWMQNPQAANRESDILEEVTFYWYPNHRMTVERHHLQALHHLSQLCSQQRIHRFAATGASLQSVTTLLRCFRRVSEETLAKTSSIKSFQFHFSCMEFSFNQRKVWSNFKEATRKLENFHSSNLILLFSKCAADGTLNFTTLTSITIIEFSQSSFYRNLPRRVLP